MAVKHGLGKGKQTSRRHGSGGDENE